MKKLIFIFISLIISSSYASVQKAGKYYFSKKKIKDRYEKITFELVKSGYYFASIEFAKAHLIETKEISDTFEKVLEKLVLRTGTQSFNDVEEKYVKKVKSPTLSFILAFKFFKSGDYDKALKYINDVPWKHRFIPEALMMKGSIHNLKNEYAEANESYSKCVELATQFEGASKHEKLKRYFAIVKESCIIHKGRVSYKQQEFKKSLVTYDEIPKVSYRWPYILIEKAWANYYLEDFNRALGLLVTYRSPLLESYFIPESEVLIALSYLKLCLWEDALKVIDRYYNVYKPRSDRLKKILLKHKNSTNFFYNLVFTPLSKSEKGNEYLRTLVTQIRKKVKFSLDLVAFEQGKKEIKRLKELKRTKFVRILRKLAIDEAKYRKRQINYFVKKNMFDFINSIHRYSFEMFNIKLDIISKKRDLVYSNKKLISKRSRGSEKNLNRKETEQLWEFQGAFWADELGDYSFGLKSNCEEVKLRGKK